MDQLPSWPLSLLDVTLATAALEDDTWLPGVISAINADAGRLQLLLAEHFGDAVPPDDIHYRFVHLPDPYPALEHLQNQGISARLCSALHRHNPRERVRLAPHDPTADAEFKQLRNALATL